VLPRRVHHQCAREQRQDDRGCEGGAEQTIHRGDQRSRDSECQSVSCVREA
jgi:hypothetical protein